MRYAAVSTTLSRGALTSFTFRGAHSASASGEEPSVLRALVSALAKHPRICGIDLKDSLAVPLLVQGKWANHIELPAWIESLAAGQSVTEAMDLGPLFPAGGYPARMLSALFGTGSGEAGHAAAIAALRNIITGRKHSLRIAESSFVAAPGPQVPWSGLPIPPRIEDDTAYWTLVVAPLEGALDTGPVGGWGSIRLASRPQYHFGQGVWNPGFSRIVGAAFSSWRGEDILLAPESEKQAIAAMVKKCEQLQAEGSIFVSQKRLFRHFLSLRAAVANAPLPSWMILPEGRDWLKSVQDVGFPISPPDPGAEAVGSGILLSHHDLTLNVVYSGHAGHIPRSVATVCRMLQDHRRGCHWKSACQQAA